MCILNERMKCICISIQIIHASLSTAFQWVCWFIWWFYCIWHFFFWNSFVTWVVFFFSFSCQLNMCAGISVSCFKTVHCWHYGYWCKCDTLIVAPVLVTGHLATRCAVHHIYRGYRHSHLGSAGHWERLSNTSHSTFEDSTKARDMQGKYMMHLTNWYLIQLTGIWYNTDVYNTVCRYVIQYTMCSLQLTTCRYIIETLYHSTVPTFKVYMVLVCLRDGQCQLSHSVHANQWSCMFFLLSLQKVLKKNGKELSAEQLDRIVAAEQTNTPLYLRLVLSVGREREWERQKGRNRA